MAISLEGDNATSILDRIDIPGEIRQSISARLTPGSSLVIGDTSINAAILPEGDDFLVLAKDAAMNIWLHKQVMIKLAENGGKVPDDLKQGSDC